VSAGTLVIGTAGALPQNGSVTISSAMQLAAGIGTQTLSSLTINSGATLDVTNNSVLLNYIATDPIAMIDAYLAGGQIMSSTVASLNASQSALIYAIGSADGADGLVTGLSSGQIEILPTLAGDAKLQGNVVFGDFQLLAQFFGSSGGWDEGNFTYGPTIDFGDFQLLAQNFGANSSALTASEIASLSSFAAAFGDRLVPNADGVGFQVVAVPEPTSIGILAAAGVGLLARRRKPRRTRYRTLGQDSR
jgi:hypothetical protein